MVRAVKPIEGFSHTVSCLWLELPGGPTEIKVEPAAAPLKVPKSTGLEMQGDIGKRTDGNHIV